MKKIKTGLVVAGASLIFVGGSAVGFASTTWVGHQNEINTQNNLHKLGDQLQTNQQKMDDSKQQLQQLEQSLDDTKHQLRVVLNQYDNLGKQKFGEEEALRLQIQQKIAETQQAIADGNNKIADKQKEIDALNQKNNDLSNQLNDSKSDLSQAVQDAQDTRTISDQLVNQYVIK